MKTFIYSWIVYPILFGLGSIWGLFNQKTRRTLALRSWQDFLSLRYNVDSKIEYWIHVASSGELEYAIPIIEELNRAQKHVLVTYYSISAKGPVESLPRTYKNVSLVVPLPHDGLGLMRNFVNLAYAQGIRKLLLLKYELWPGLLWECNRKHIGVFLVNALKPSWFHQKLIHKLSGILSGYPAELSEVNHPHIQVVGDTRVKRVKDRVQDSRELLSDSAKNILKRSRTLICGSFWEPDSKMLFEGLKLLSEEKPRKPLNVVWFPHELDVDKKSIEESFHALGYQTFTYDEFENIQPEKVDLNKPTAIIAIKKGILVEFYKYGDCSFVGGGYTTGVHSVWEPMLSKKYVACGPKIDRSPEAQVLRANGLLNVISKPSDFVKWIDSIPGEMSPADLTKLEHIEEAHRHAAQKIVEYCMSH